MINSSDIRKRPLYLAAGVFAMLFSGVLYAWSILKVPFADLNISPSVLSLNFTITMCFFCIGAFIGSLIAKKAGIKTALIISAILIASGFILTGMVDAKKAYLMYISYGFLAGNGIGIAYNVVVSTVNAWFPDKKGLSSGCLMMGFGVSTLLLGEVISKLFASSFGWRKTYVFLGILIAAVIIISALILKKPSADTPLPAPKEGKVKETLFSKDFSPIEMIKTFTFWKAFLIMAFLAAVGNSVISFARDLAISVNATPSLATTLVGVLSIFNGVGRILTGILYDAFGRRKTMISANMITAFAALSALVAVKLSSLPLLIAALCLTGLSYGSCPTVSAAFTESFFGRKHFATNYSITNFSLIATSFIANFSNSLLQSTGSYTAPFIMLLALSVISLVINYTLKK